MWRIEKPMVEWVASMFQVVVMAMLLVVDGCRCVMGHL
jgi:hypothetical protein